jgi:flagellar M-ring protein FliF
MNSYLQQLRERLSFLEERWKALSMRVRVGILSGLAVAAALGVLLYAQQAGPNRTILFANLSPDDGARITERLRSMNVDYELTQGGTAVEVDESRVHEARLSLAAEGLPSGGGVGFEIFDQQRFGESDFSEQVQFRRALEGELARTVRHLAGVENARVHLVLPERSLFARSDQTASASVVVHLRPGWRLRPEQISGVTHLVASSVPDLDVENVTLVDGNGRSLQSEDAEGQGGEDLRTQLERDRQRDVQQLLDASLGPGVAVVRVSAEVDMSHLEQLEETYDPDQIATRSFELNVIQDPEAEGDAQGVPGAAANLPGGAGAETTGGTGAATRRTERRNYEVTKTVRRRVRPVGGLARLSVAVVVDGHWTGPAGAREFEPRSEEELQRIQSLVTSAAGIRADRGDVVSVECVPFAESRTAIPLSETPWWVYALAALVALLVLAAVGYLVLRMRWSSADGDEPARDGQGAQELPAPRPVSDLLGPEATAAADRVNDEMAGQLQQYEQLRALALEVARRDPELAARVVRGWLEADLQKQLSAELEDAEARAGEAEAA